MEFLKTLPRDLIIAVLSGGVAAFLTAVFTHISDLRVERQKKKKSEEEEAFVYFLMIADLIASVQLCTSMIKSMGEPLIAIARIGGYDFNKYDLEHLIIAIICDAGLNKGDTSLQNLIDEKMPWIRKSAESILEFAIPNDVLVRLPRETRKNYVQFSASAKILKLSMSHIDKMIIDFDSRKISSDAVFSIWSQSKIFYELSLRVMLSLQKECGISQKQADDIIKDLFKTHQHYLLDLENGKQKLSAAVLHVKILKESKSKRETEEK